MKLAYAVLAMVTFLSWMANVRTSFFIVRVLVGNRNGLTLRSVGLNSMLPLVFCLRREWPVVCQRVRSVHQFLLWRMWAMAFLVLFGFFSVSCAFGWYWHCWCTSFCGQGLGHIGVPPAGHALWAEVVGGITSVTSGENAWQHIKLPVISVGVEVTPLEGSHIC